MRDLAGAGAEINPRAKEETFWGRGADGGRSWKSWSEPLAGEVAAAAGGSRVSIARKEDERIRNEGWTVLGLAWRGHARCFNAGQIGPLYPYY